MPHDDGIGSRAKEFLAKFERMAARGAATASGPNARDLADFAAAEIERFAGEWPTIFSNNLDHAAGYNRCRADMLAWAARRGAGAGGGEAQ